MTYHHLGNFAFTEGSTVGSSQATVGSQNLSLTSPTEVDGSRSTGQRSSLTTTVDNRSDMTLDIMSTDPRTTVARQSTYPTLISSTPDTTSNERADMNYITGAAQNLATQGTFPTIDQSTLNTYLHQKAQADALKAAEAKLDAILSGGNTLGIGPGYTGTSTGGNTLKIGPGFTRVSTGRPMGTDPGYTRTSGSDKTGMICPPGTPGCPSWTSTAPPCHPWPSCGQTSTAPPCHPWPSCGQTSTAPPCHPWPSCGQTEPVVVVEEEPFYKHPAVIGGGILLLLAAGYALYKGQGG